MNPKHLLATFETDPGSGAAVADPPAGAGADPQTAADAPGAEGAAAEATPSADAGAPAPAGALLTPEDVENFRSMRQDINELFAALREPDPGYGHDPYADSGQQAPEEIILDPINMDPREFTQKQQQLFDQRLAAHLGPIAAWIESQQIEKGQTRTEAVLEGLSDLDAFAPSDPEHGQTFKEMARFFADQAHQEVRRELGVRDGQHSPRAAEIALRRGAEKVAAFAKAQREAGKQGYIAEMEAVRNADRDVAGAGHGGIRQPSTEGLDEMGIAARYVTPAA